MSNSWLRVDGVFYSWRAKELIPERHSGEHERRPRALDVWRWISIQAKDGKDILASRCANGVERIAIAHYWRTLIVNQHLEQLDCCVGSAEALRAVAKLGEIEFLDVHVEPPVSVGLGGAGSNHVDGHAKLGGDLGTNRGKPNVKFIGGAFPDDECINWSELPRRHRSTFDGVVSSVRDRQSWSWQVESTQVALATRQSQTGHHGGVGTQTRSALAAS